MPWRKKNPYPPHTFHRFAWNVYHLLVYQFGRYAIYAWIAMTIALVLSFVRIQGLISANHNRIEDIQESRITSCERTYRAIEEVLKPFYPPKKVRTPAQAKAVIKFELLIHNKVRTCRNQTNTFIKNGKHH